MQNNGKIQVTKLHHDIDVIKRQVERAKIKLTGEIKVSSLFTQSTKLQRPQQQSSRPELRLTTPVYNIVNNN